MASCNSEEDQKLHGAALSSRQPWLPDEALLDVVKQPVVRPAVLAGVEVRGQSCVGPVLHAVWSGGVELELELAVVGVGDLRRLISIGDEAVMVSGNRTASVSTMPVSELAPVVAANTTCTLTN